MARYDYGLRGTRETNGPRFDELSRFRYEDVRRADPAPGMKRVTARYGQDYLRERGSIYPRNATPFRQDRRGTIEEEDSDQPRYLARGGTWTQPGAIHPHRYDRRDFGPDYSGRAPDEI